MDGNVAAAAGEVHIEQLSLFDMLFAVEKEEKDVTCFSERKLQAQCIEGHHWYQEYVLLMHTDETGKEYPEYWWKKSDLALLEGNKVYFKEPFSYPFMKIFKSEKEARKFYLEKLKLIESHFILSEPPYHQGSIVRVDKSDECFFEDMHFCEGQDWYSCFEYADRQKYGYRAKERGDN